jgi:hypothetical protein
MPNFLLMLWNVLMLLYVLSLLIAVALVVVFAIKMNRQKKIQDRIVSWVGSPGSGLAGASWYRIKFSRPAYYAKIFKSMGCKGRGVLVNQPQQVRVLGELDSGERFDWCYPKNALALQWIGSPGWPSGNMHWFSLGAGAQQVMVTADTGLYAIPSRQNTADIYRSIAPHFELSASAQSEFALEKNPATRAAVIVLLALFVFAGFDVIAFNKYALLDIEPVPIVGALFVLLIVVLPLVYWLLSRPRWAVPWRESVGVSLLLGLALCAAWLPALKRIDQYLSVEGPKPYTYRLGADDLFTPVDKGPPEFHDRKPGWSAIKKGDICEFLLLHGPLGLWQLDTANLSAMKTAGCGRH